MNEMPVSLIEWKPVIRNSLRGFAKVRIGKAMIMHEVALHCSHERRWASPPSKPQLDSDGNVRRDDRGKIKYSPVIEWASREMADAFSNGVIDAVEREYPGATQAEAA